mmetsp:Transcript_51915/g.150841  ORF Transcript_51915/g.150841 Transcript_51915/m.150841 type:complete len:408 (-) Transcript_51915:88-1311(-)
MAGGREWEPYHFQGRRRQLGPGRRFHDWKPEVAAKPAVGRQKPLINALLRNDMMTAQGLVMAGADINEDRDDSGRAALHLASSSGCAGLVRMLAENSADLSLGVASEAPFTALHLAGLHGHNTVLRVLLDARAEPNPPSEHLEPPLCRCAGDGNTEAVRLLLKARAHVDTYGSCDESNLEAATVTFSALLRATERNADSPVVEELILGGANLAAMDSDLNQPLHVAVRKGNLRVVRCLLDARADPNCANQSLRTPMHNAVVNGDARAITLLVQFEGDLQMQDDGGKTPLDLVEDHMTQLLLGKLVRERGGAASKSSTPPALCASPGRYRLTADQVLSKSTGCLAQACLGQERKKHGRLKALQVPLSGLSSAASSPASSLPVTPSPLSWRNSSSKRRSGSCTPALAWN